MKKSTYFVINVKKGVDQGFFFRYWKGWRVGAFDGVPDEVKLDKKQLKLAKKAFQWYKNNGYSAEIIQITETIEKESLGLL